MARITYVEHSGETHAVEVSPGFTVMEGAVWNDIRGIYADCGGDGGCATCHVYVEKQWLERVGARSSKEAKTLRFALDVRENSRLSCFIEVSDHLDGLVVHMPRRQF
jgi:2Fe-2S ferredoxin